MKKTLFPQVYLKLSLSLFSSGMEAIYSSQKFQPLLFFGLTNGGEKKSSQLGLPWWSSGWASSISLQGVGVRSLIGN